MSVIIMNTIGSTYDFQSTDGKNLGEIVDGMEWIKIAEKKIGKGKGKTVAAISVPTLEYENPIFQDAMNVARRDYLTAMYRSGKKNMNNEECDVDAVTNWYIAQSFSGESIAQWFDNEMSDYLTMNIAIAKGWNYEELDEEQEKYISPKLVAYKAAFMECAAKFPKLAPEQKQELIRVIDLNNLSGGIVDRIKEKIQEKKVELADALGF